ncbi:hypothetical protein [Acidimangrovimonas pyrenivorans]|uniref:DUF3562 domain-containing protein n=1 Tax=Acidimangrovimonas pyrenivorans TaxID=2030798 RepID=A0ABV7ADE7_9RHOB
MSALEDLADALARDTLAAMDELGNDRLHEEIAQIIGASSPTLQEVYLTAMRYHLAEQRGRKALERKLAAARAAGE